MEDIDPLLEATTALIPPLLTAIDVLQHAARHMHPPNIPQLVQELEPSVRREPTGSNHQRNL